MKNIKKFEAFSDEIHIHPTLSNFSKEDMQDFYDEFQIIADNYNLTEVNLLIQIMKSINIILEFLKTPL